MRGARVRSRHGEVMFRPSNSRSSGPACEPPVLRRKWSEREAHINHESARAGGPIDRSVRGTAATATVSRRRDVGPRTSRDRRVESFCGETRSVTRFALRETVTGADAGAISALDAVGSASVDASAPFARAYAGESAPLVHVIEPRVQGAIVAERTSGAYWSMTGRPVALTSGRVGLASAGLRTAWGRLLGQSGGSLEGDAGAIAPGEAVHRCLPVVRLRTAWSRFLGGGEAAIGFAPRADGSHRPDEARRTRRWHMVIKAAAASASSRWSLARSWLRALTNHREAGSRPRGGRGRGNRREVHTERRCDIVGTRGPDIQDVPRCTARSSTRTRADDSRMRRGKAALTGWNRRGCRSILPQGVRITPCLSRRVRLTVCPRTAFERSGNQLWQRPRLGSRLEGSSRHLARGGRRSFDARVLASILCGHGYPSRRATTGRRRSRVSRGGISLALLDIMMPRLSGLRPVVCSRA